MGYDTLDKLRFVVESQEMVEWKVKLDIYDSAKGAFPQLFEDVAAAVMESETDANILFSTVHRAKGLGWPSVLLLDDFLSNHGGDSVPEEELNICYVALSRVSTGTLYLTFDPLFSTRSLRSGLHP